MVGVAIPARDEHDGIADALHAVGRALDDPALAYAKRVIVVADDDSSDETGVLARRALGRRGEVIKGSFGSAGSARRAALERLLQIASGLPRERVWLATTDADSRVPRRGSRRRSGVGVRAPTRSPAWSRRSGRAKERRRFANATRR